MNSVLAKPDRRAVAFTWVFCLLCAFSLLLGRLPYRGIRHDGILYAGQALAHLNPFWAAQDLYFAHGSQDNFSIFSRIVAWGLRHADTGTVDMVVLRIAVVAWVAALVALTGAMGLSWRERWLGIFAVLGASHFYGNSRIFSFMEPFVTARTWSEPVALMALILLLRGRLVFAVAMLLLAMALHPLMALPVAVVGFLYLVLSDRRWLALSLLALPVLGLAFAGIAPFDALLKTYDHDWMMAIVWANNIVFLSNWHFADLASALVNSGILWLTWRRSDGPMARLQRAVIAAVPILCLVSFVGSDLMHNVLITQLQLWRIFWVLDVLALASLPMFLLREWRKGPAGQVAAVAVFVAVCAVDAWLPTGWALACWACLALLLSARGIALQPSIVRMAIGATLLVGLGLLGLQWLNASQQLSMHAQGTAIAQTSSIPFTLPIVTLPFFYLLIRGWERGGRLRAVAAVVAAGLFVFSATQWDQRSPWARYIETVRPGTHPFDALIPPDAQVYWHDDTAATWVLLQRANFFSAGQSAGLLFNRGTSMVALQRGPALLGVMGDQAKCSSLEMLGARSLDAARCELHRDNFLKFCSLTPTHADFLVASTDFGTGVVSRWRFVPGDGSPPVTYSLYDCSKLR